jgi:glutamate/tyrosine decarboxylase-like PLP-dependent enzyme
LRPRTIDWLFDKGQRFPAVRARLEREYAAMLATASAGAPRERDDAVTALPATGRSREEILAAMEALAAREAPLWRDGHASGSVYHGDPDHIAFLDRVYALHSQSNPLHADIWPSAGKFEAEIVAMTAAMLNGSGAEGESRVSGTVTSGGTESIVLAMKAYRDYGRRVRGIARPEVVVPASAHAAFDKARDILGLRVIKVPVAADLRADVAAMARAITRRTVALVGSAPSFPHGVIDPIPQLAELAGARGVGLHVDACLGGFVLPFAARLLPAGQVPAFDFRLPAVTSMSADPHKYGYAAKGVSVVLYRGAELRRQQYFVNTDWSGGLYFSPTFAGSRPGGLSAACWAAMVNLGDAGYLDATRRILASAAEARAAIAAIPGLRVLGDPLWVIAFEGEGFDIYRVLDLMNARGWSLNGLQRPPAVHLCVTLRHTQPGVIARFAAELGAAVAEVKASPPRPGGMAPVYGMAGKFPVRGAVAELLRRYVDKLYEP